MKEEDFILIVNSAEINRNGIAKKMYPDSKYPNTKLANKIAKTQNRTGAQRLTEEDLKKGEEVLRQLANNIISKL